MHIKKESTIFVIKYLVAFVNFNMEELGEKFRTDVVLCDMQDKKVFSDKERFIFLQLPKFTKEPEECTNDFERWIYVLKNMEVLDRMPWIAKDSVFHKLAQIAEVSNLSKEDRIKYDSALRHLRDTYSVMKGVENKGMVKGRAEANSEIAKKLKTMGMPLEQISEATGLSVDAIKTL